ncbi:MAG: peptidoglycan DD-metalloendopeptidase family protein [Flavobacteriales bacterium]|nr:peptidoglycan DD-metalloendopeptidase family protein [Flavobacteriales bacterium]
MIVDSIHPILGFELNNSNSQELDLSEGKLKDLGIDSGDNDQLSDYIFNGKVRYGGYGEQRDIYKRGSQFEESANRREIHLGLDIWSPKGTALFCPWNGIVRSCHNNDRFADYGPTLIIEHNFDELKIYMLLGHLGEECLTRWKTGQSIEAGDRIASIGSEDENGGWPPHVHIQLIRDLEGCFNDYPGVCTKAEWPRMRKNCPDPSSYFVPSN